MPPRHFVSGNRINGVFIYHFTHDHKVPARMRSPKENWITGRAAQVEILRIFQYLFDFFFRNSVFGTVICIAMRVVIKVPDDCLIEHDVQLATAPVVL